MEDRLIFKEFTWKFKDCPETFLSPNQPDDKTNLKQIKETLFPGTNGHKKFMTISMRGRRDDATETQADKQDEDSQKASGNILLNYYIVRSPGSTRVWKIQPAPKRDEIVLVNPGKWKIRYLTHGLIIHS